MLNFMKYEIRGTYRYIVGVLILSLVLFTAVYHYADGDGTTSLASNLFSTLCMLLLFGTGLVTFLHIVGSFRKELYEDTGYLTYTLPLTGYQITAAKLLVALLWFFVLSLAITVYNFVLLYIYLPVEISFIEMLRQIAEIFSFRQAVAFLTTGVVSGVSLLILIYFSMALSRVTFRNRKIGGLWFVIFLILAAVLAFGKYKITSLLPYSIEIDSLNSGNLNYGSDNFMVSVSSASVNINIAAFIYNLLTAAVLFLGTGYLVEMKTDL